MTDKPSIGFVGIGNMGWPMAACLVRAGFDVRVADARRVQADNFVQQVGGFAADSLQALAAQTAPSLIGAIRSFPAACSAQVSK